MKLSQLKELMEGNFCNTTSDGSFLSGMIMEDFLGFIYPEFRSLAILRADLKTNSSFSLFSQLLTAFLSTSDLSNSDNSNATPLCSSLLSSLRVSLNSIEEYSSKLRLGSAWWAVVSTSMECSN